MSTVKFPRPAPDTSPDELPTQRVGSARGLGVTGLLPVLYQRRGSLVFWFMVGTVGMGWFLLSRPSMEAWKFAVHITTASTRDETERVAEALVRYTAKEIAAAPAHDENGHVSINDAQVYFPVVKVGRTAEPLRASFIVELEAPPDAKAPEALKELADRIEKRAVRLAQRTTDDVKESLEVLETRRDALQQDPTAALSERSAAEVAYATMKGSLVNRPECEISAIVRGEGNSYSKPAQVGAAIVFGALFAVVCTLAPHFLQRVRHAAG